MRQKNMQKIITYKWLIFIFILFFNSNSAAYDLNQKDEVILDRLEQRIMTVINTKKSVTPVWIVELIENSLDTWKYNQRIESILRELKDRIDTVYLVSKFAEVDWPTPILYTSDFATQFGWQDWVTLNFDRFGEIDAVEHIAPAGTVFQIHEYRWKRRNFKKTKKYRGSWLCVGLKYSRGNTSAFTIISSISRDFWKDKESMDAQMSWLFRNDILGFQLSNSEKHFCNC